MSKQTNVPALERGLDILEFVAARGEAGYSQIIDELGLPPASAARLLKCLCQRDYLSKSPDTGDYRIGVAPGKLMAEPNRSEELRQAGQPVLTQLRDLTESTAVLFHWNGIAWECIAKAAHEDSITMQHVGETRVDIFGYPWGVFAYNQLLNEKRRLVLDPDEKELVQARKRFETDGYACSRGRTFSRYAVPILTTSGELLGALAMGVLHASEDFDEDAITEPLVRSGKQIEEQIRR